MDNQTTPTDFNKTSEPNIVTTPQLGSMPINIMGITPDLSQSNQSEVFVSQISNVPTYTRQHNLKTKLLIISILVVSLASIAIGLFLVIHITNKKQPLIQTSSDIKISANNRSQTPKLASESINLPKPVSTSCNVPPGIMLSCYTIMISSSSTSGSLLFYPNSTMQQFDGITYLTSTTSNSEPNIQLAQNGNGKQNSCRALADSSFIFSYLSNGKSEDACKTSVSGGTQYTGAANLNGQDYSIVMFSKSPVTSNILETIFSSVKPN